MGLAVALVAAMAIAGSAQATATKTINPWKTGTEGGGVSVLAGSEALTMSMNETGVLEAEVGETPVVLQWSELACISCTIFNEGGAGKAKGKLEMRKMTVVKPAACKVKEEKVLTNELAIDATYMEGTTWAQRFAPASGEALATITLEKGSGSCPIAGPYILKGIEFSTAFNLTNTFTVIQSFKFNPTSNVTLGGSISLAAKPAKWAFTARGQISIGHIWGM